MVLSFREVGEMRSGTAAGRPRDAAWLSDLLVRWQGYQGIKIM